jgi:hypothetical protein
MHRCPSPAPPKAVERVGSALSTPDGSSLVLHVALVALSSLSSLSSLSRLARSCHPPSALVLATARRLPAADRCCSAVRARASVHTRHCRRRRQPLPPPPPPSPPRPPPPLCPPPLRSTPRHLPGRERSLRGGAHCGAGKDSLCLSWEPGRPLLLLLRGGEGLALLELGAGAARAEGREQVKGQVVDAQE